MLYSYMQTETLFEVNTVDNDFLLTVSSGIIFRHLRDLVNACKIQKTLTIAKDCDLSTDLTQKFLAGFREWKFVIFSDKTQVMFDHSRHTCD